MSTTFNLPAGLKNLTPKSGSRYALEGVEVRPDPDQDGMALIGITDGRALAVVETEASGLGGKVFVPRDALREGTAVRDGDGDRFLITPASRRGADIVAICPVDQQFPPLQDVIPDPQTYRVVCRVDVDLLHMLAQALNPSDKHLTLLCRLDAEDSVKRPLIALGERGTLGVIMPMAIDGRAESARVHVDAMRERVRRASLSADILAAENAERDARAVAENPLGPEAARALMSGQIAEALAEAA